MRVSFDEMYTVMRDRLCKYGVGQEIAEGCARNLAENSLNGVYSHGLNRFMRVITMVKNGSIKPDNRPECINRMGALEQWDGNLGMGNTNAALCMGRAITLAKEHGIGCVALRHTNHWQRGGAFGIQAAQAGCVGICWTNTVPCMPAWGAKDCRIGNNPLVFCSPYQGEYVLFDGAMAQFSYGALESARLAGRQLSVAGGYNEQGNLTTDPAEIEKTRRVLPIGFWKGSGFSILLDMLAAGLSSGMSSADIGKQGGTPTDEYNISQVFIAIAVPDTDAHDKVIRGIIDDLKQSTQVHKDTPILYPSERSQTVSRENAQQGIPVNEAIWNAVLAL